MKSLRQVSIQKLQLRSLILLFLLFMANILTLLHFSYFSHSVDLRTGELLETHQLRDLHLNPNAANPSDKDVDFARIDEPCDHAHGALAGHHHGRDESCSFAQALRNSVVMGHMLSDVIGFEIVQAGIQIPASLQVVRQFPLFLLARKNSPPGSLVWLVRLQQLSTPV